MSSNALFVHVPVDQVDIINGPTLDRMLWVRFRCQRNQAVEQGFLLPNDVNSNTTTVEFTLRTTASTRPFKRRITLATVSETEGSTVQFTAIFNDRVVSGAYDTRQRTGFFSLD